MASSEVQRLAALVAGLQDQVSALSRERRLAAASMEGGAIGVYQPGTGGAPGVKLGEQFDGSYGAPPLGGPVPPQPTGVTVTTKAETAILAWGGTFVGGAVAPMDWSRAEAHVGTSPDFDGLSAASFKTTIESPRGGEVSVFGLTPGVNYWAKLTARSKAGKFSVPSNPVGPFQVHRLGVADIDIAAMGGNTIFRRDATPTGEHKIGDLWLRTTDNVALRWQGATPAWVAVPNQAPVVAAIEKAFAETPGADTVQRFGTDSIQPASLVASTLVATGTIDAALLAAILVLATTIIAGDPDGEHVRLDPQGLRVFRGDLNGDGVPDESVRMGVFGAADRLATVRGDGALGFVADEDGFVTAAGLSVAGSVSVGKPDYTGRGGDLIELLDRRPRGIVRRHADFGTYDFSTTAGRGIFDIGARLYDGRLYKICVRGRTNGSVANDALAEVQVRYEYGLNGIPPVSPTINSAMAGRLQVSTPHPDAQGFYFEKPFSWGFGSNFRDHRFLLCVSRPVGGTTLTLYGADPDGIEMWIEDIGLFQDNAGTPNDGGGTVSNPGPPPAPQQTRYQRTWICNWHQNWRGNGSFVDLGDVYQGPDPSGSNGVMKSYLGFSGTATDGSGLTMDAALAGARIEEVGLYLFYPHWYSYAGGSAVIGMHGFRNPAGSYGGGNDWMHGQPGWKRNEGKWISLGAYSPQNWATGTWKGILLGSPSATSTEYYGRADAEGSAQLSVVYWK